MFSKHQWGKGKVCIVANLYAGIVATYPHHKGTLEKDNNITTSHKGVGTVETQGAPMDCTYAQVVAYDVIP